MPDKLKKQKLLPALIAALLLGLALIVFSDNNESGTETETQSFFDESMYEESLEERLKEIVEEIDGVGEVRVMLTLEGSALYTYATDTSQDTKAEGDSKRESTIVLSANGSNSKEAVVRGYTLPEIKGAAIVCSKKLTPTLQSKVIGVASAALGISTSKIYVTN